MSTRAEIRERWRRILHQQQSSGRLASVFCREHGVSLPRFYKWRRKLHDGGTFAELKLRPARMGGTTADGIELRLPGQRSLVVRPGFDRQTLIELLAVLEASSDTEACV